MVFKGLVPLIIPSVRCQEISICMHVNYCSVVYAYEIDYFVGQSFAFDRSLSNVVQCVIFCCFLISGEIISILFKGDNLISSLLFNAFQCN